MDDVFRLVLAQIRSKHETAGDFRAQIAANNTGVRRVQALVDAARPRRRSLRDDGRAARVHRAPHARRARGAAARRLRGRGRRRQRRLHRRAGAAAGARRASAPTASRFDTTGSDPQRRAPVNSTYAMTFSACAYALKCLVDPDLPVNDGFYRLLDVARAGGHGHELHAGRRAVVGGWETQTRLVEVIFRALLPAFPERLPAGTKGMMCQAGFGSLDVEAGDVHVLLRHVRRRLRRAASRATAPTRCRRTARTPRTRRSRRPSSTTRCGSTRLVARRGLRGPGPLPRRARAAQGLPLRPARRRSRSSPTATASGRGASFGGHDGRVAEYVHDPRRRRDAARLEGDARARARRRDQRAHVRRRRLRPARGARPRARRCATSRGQGARAGARGLQRRSDGASTTRRRRCAA